MPSESPFKLARMSFWCISIFLWALTYFPTEEDISRLSYILFAPNLASVISPRSLVPFREERYLEIKIWAVGVLTALERYYVSPDLVLIGVPRDIYEYFCHKLKSESGQPLHFSSLPKIHGNENMFNDSIGLQLEKFLNVGNSTGQMIWFLQPKKWQRKKVNKRDILKLKRTCLNPGIQTNCAG